MLGNRMLAYGERLAREGCGGKLQDYTKLKSCGLLAIMSKAAKYIGGMTESFDYITRSIASIRAGDGNRCGMTAAILYRNLA